jgi:hypothetical protein
LGIELFPFVLVPPLPLLKPFVNDDEGNDKSLFVTEELFDSLPFKIGVK